MITLFDKPYYIKALPSCWDAIEWKTKDQKQCNATVKLVFYLLKNVTVKKLSLRFNLWGVFGYYPFHYLGVLPNFETQHDDIAESCGITDRVPFISLIQIPFQF